MSQYYAVCFDDSGRRTYTEVLSTHTSLKSAIKGLADGLGGYYTEGAIYTIDPHAYYTKKDEPFIVGYMYFRSVYPFKQKSIHWKEYYEKVPSKPMKEWPRYKVLSGGKLKELDKDYHSMFR